MKRSISMSLAVLTVIALSIPAAAVPRLQTYIVDSQYSVYHSGLDYFTWVSNSSNFDLKVVGYWGPDAGGGNEPGILHRPMYKAPAYDYMDCYLAMSVPRNQSGQIFINGVEISAFEKWLNAIPTGTHPSPSILFNGPSLKKDYSFLNIGRIDNNQVGALHYGFGCIQTPGWGDELTMNVVVRGFDWAHFDAIGIDSRGNTITNSQFYDSSYYATPEPSTLSLLGLGLLGIAPLLRRKKR
jgi:hypothetical protein